MDVKDIEISKIGTMSDRLLSNAIVTCKQKAKQLNEELDDAKYIYAQLEQELLKRYEEEGQTSTTFIDPDGRKRTLYVTKKLNPIAKFSYADDAAGALFFDVLTNHGMEHLLNRTPGEAMRSARGVFKEMFESDGSLPADIEEFVEMKTESAISLRSS